MRVNYKFQHVSIVNVTSQPKFIVHCWGNKKKSTIINSVTKNCFCDKIINEERKREMEKERRIHQNTHEKKNRRNSLEAAHSCISYWNDNVKCINIRQAKEWRRQTYGIGVEHENCVDVGEYENGAMSRPT